MTCAVCGRPVRDDEQLLAWMADTESDTGEPERTCPECTRGNVRSIEAKLDPQWW